MKSLQMYRNLFANIIKIRKSGRFFFKYGRAGVEYCREFDYFAQLKRRMSMNLKALLEPVGTFAWWRSMFAIVLGCLIMAVGYSYFVSPYNIVPGGVYGMGIVLHNVFPSIQVGTFGYMIDVPLLASAIIVFRPAVRRPHALRRLPHAGSDKPALVDRLSQPGGARSARSQAALRRCDRPVERPDARVAAGSRAHRSGSGVGAAQSGYDRRYGHHRHVSAKIRQDEILDGHPARRFVRRAVGTSGHRFRRGERRRPRGGRGGQLAAVVLLAHHDLRFVARAGLCDRRRVVRQTALHHQ